MGCRIERALKEQVPEIKEVIMLYPGRLHRKETEYELDRRTPR